MKKNRLEAFTDGVLAIIITIMILGINVPNDAGFQSLVQLFPVFFIYLVSFIYIGVYWNIHHNLFQLAKKINSKILWSNLNLMFWLSLTPLATHWVFENYKEPFPMAFYGFVLLMSAISYFILEAVIVKFHNDDCIKKVVKNNQKRNITLVIYLTGIAISFVYPLISMALFTINSIIWAIPNKKVENSFNDNF